MSRRTNNVPGDYVPGVNCTGRLMYWERNVLGDKCTGRQMYWETNVLGDKCTGDNHTGSQMYRETTVLRDNRTGRQISLMSLLVGRFIIPMKYSVSRSPIPTFHVWPAIPYQVGQPFHYLIFLTSSTLYFSHLLPHVLPTIPPFLLSVSSGSPPVSDFVIFSQLHLHHIWTPSSFSLQD